MFTGIIQEPALPAAEVVSSKFIVGDLLQGGIMQNSNGHERRVELQNRI